MDSATQTNPTIEEHFNELRAVVRQIAYAMLGCMLFSLLLSNNVLTYFTPKDTQLILSNPTEAVTLTFNTAVLLTLLILLPYITYKMLRYISPESHGWKLYSLPFTSLVLFALGSAVGYAIAKTTIDWSYSYGEGLGFVNLWNVTEYLNFMIITSLLFGVIAQTPLITRTLINLGIVTNDTLKRYRRYYIFGAILLTAIISPQGDALSLALMSAPIIIIYEVSIALGGSK